MPTIKDFAKTQEPSRASKASAASKLGKSSRQTKRRPGRDQTSQHESHVVNEQETSTMNTETMMNENHQAPQGHETHEHEGQGQDPRQKVKIEFYGSEILREKAPKAFELAETVAEEWVNDGKFEALPVGHPLAQFAAQQGLLKAKEIEKKLEEKGVFALARLGLEYAKTKLNRR